MTSLRFDDLRQYSDVVRSRRGEAVTIRFVEPRDGEELQNYFRSLSARSRYNRFLGAMSELPEPVLDRFTHVSEAAGFVEDACARAGAFRAAGVRDDAIGAGFVAAFDDGDVGAEGMIAAGDFGFEGLVGIGIEARDAAIAGFELLNQMREIAVAG